MSTQWTDERTIDDLRVEITYNQAMSLPAPPKSGAQWSISPGIGIRVTLPEPLQGTPRGHVLYDTLTSEQYGAPGRHVFDETRKNTMGRMGAYVFEPTTGDELEAWITTRVSILVDQAHSVLAQRERAQILGARIAQENPRFTVEVMGGGVRVTDTRSDYLDIASPEQWEREQWLLR